MNRPFTFVIPAVFGASMLLAAQAPAPPPVEEITIARIHAAFKDGTLTCRGLVEQYLRRIETYDKNGPAVNAIVLTNPHALATAEHGGDRAQRIGGRRG